MFINIKKIVIISACALVLTGCQTNAENSSVSSSIDTNISDSISSTSEESSIAQTTGETTTKPVETPKPAETETLQTTVSTTKAPETTVTTAATTKAPEWTEEKLEATKYIAETCYSRNKAVIGAEAVKQYVMGDSVKVIAKTNTGYFKLKNGEFIHGDYLSDTKVEPPKQVSNEEFAADINNSKPAETTNSNSSNTNYGNTNSGDKILGYTGDGNAIIGYTPDGDPYIAEGSDEYGEYWVMSWNPDGSPDIYYKDQNIIFNDTTSMKDIDWEY